MSAVRDAIAELKQATLNAWSSGTVSAFERVSNAYDALAAALDPPESSQLEAELLRVKREVVIARNAEASAKNALRELERTIRNEERELERLRALKASLPTWVIDAFEKQPIDAEF